MPILKDFKALDSSLKSKVEGLTVINETGNTYTVPVFYLDPEADTTKETYPFISVYRMGVYEDNQHWDNSPYFDSPTYSDDGTTLLSVSEREAPRPYSVYFGVRLYYQYQEHGRIMNNFMLTTFPRDSYLSIDGEKYDVKMISYRSPNSSYRTFGEEKTNKPREFIDQYLYRVDILLDTAPRETKTITQAVETTVHIL